MQVTDSGLFNELVLGFGIYTVLLLLIIPTVLGLMAFYAYSRYKGMRHKGTGKKDVKNGNHASMLKQNSVKTYVWKRQVKKKVITSSYVNKVITESDFFDNY